MSEQEPVLTLSVKAPSSSEFVVVVIPSGSTGLALKQEIAKNCGVSLEQQKVLIAGKCVKLILPSE